MLYQEPPHKHRSTRTRRSLRSSRAVICDWWREGEETAQVFKVQEDGQEAYYLGKLGGNTFERVTRID